MTRFDADDPAERRKLFADAIAAHRTRESPYLTIEAERTAETGSQSDSDEPPPWIQFAERTFNLDCTDEELERLKSLLSEFPEFRIDRLETPEEAEGTNVRISARSDANRLADFAERTFREVYDCGENYRAWVVEI